MEVLVRAVPVDPEFWLGRRVLVTGHTGFKGSWLCAWLQRMGAETTGYALPPDPVRSLFDTARIGDGMQRSVLADMRDAERLFETLRDVQPEVVFHLAAQPLVRASYADPVGTYATNVMGTVHLLDAVRRVPGVHAVVVVTTDKCYENREWLWGYREQDTLGGHDPYSNSKACAELVAAAYRDSFYSADRYSEHGVAVATARAGNVIGGGDDAHDRLVPDLLRALQRDEEVVLRRPHAVRPWQHVLEPLAGYLQLAQALYEHGPRYGQAWNFGASEHDSHTVEYIVRALIQALGRGSYRVATSDADPHEAGLLKLDSSKARALLNWSPRWTLEQTLASIAEWHSASEANRPMGGLLQEQIARYAQA
jgi:CDP-glucose 4,6-dehydratase